MHATLDQLGWTPDLDEAFRPHADAGLTPGRVVSQHRGGYVVATGGDEIHAEAAGRLRHEAASAEDLPAVGDWVALRAGTLVEAVLPRRTAFVRKVAWQATEAQVLGANVDVVFLAMALTEQDFKPRRLERYLVLAWESGAQPVVVLTKRDLCDDVEERVAEVERVAIAVPVHAVSSVTGEGIEEVERWVEPARTVVLLGSSGAGKSTLVNRLAGEEVAATGEVRASDGRGRHTTTRRELLALPNGALVLDTPGLRELQLWSADDGLETGFADVEELATRCRFSDCAHDGEPGCAVESAVAAGDLDPERLRSYEKLQRELASLARRQDKRAQSEQRKQYRRWERERRSRVW